MNAGLPARVQVALDAAAGAETVLVLSSALAHALGSELAVVFVESATSVSAAALPLAQVLPHAGSPWVPLRAEDVELGFRSQVARVRRLAARIAAGHGLRWSLRVTRGSLAETAALPDDDPAMLFLAGAPPPGARGTTPGRRRPLVALAAEDAAPGSPALAAATQLARAIGGVLQPWPPGSPGGSGAQRGWSARPDVMVMTRRALLPSALDLTRWPVLLVGGR